MFRKKERLTDGLSFRTYPAQRKFLEAFAEDYRVSLCEAARRVLDIGIEAIEHKNKGDLP